MHNHSEGSPAYVIQAGSIRDIRLSPFPASPSGRAASPEAENDALDGLAREVLDQWRDEANVRGLRDRIPMVIPWELDQGHGDRPPGEEEEQEHVEQVGLGELVTRVRALSPHQLVITGPAGAGKSSLAVLLVLGLLEDRAAGSPQAVPVILSMPDWEPGTSIQDWVIGRVHEDYGALVPGLDQHLVRSLVQGRRIIPVLDGFDELLPLAREEAVEALKRSLGTDGPLVLTSRPEAYRHAVASAPFLRGIPVLRAGPVRPEVGLAYLSRMCHQSHAGSWQSVFDAAGNDPAGPLATVLSSPLMLWLAATLYASQETDPRELLDEERLSTQAAIEGHLLDGLIPTVYSQGPRPSYLPGPVRPWKHEDALAYFRFLAEQLHRRRTQAIAWWQLRSVLTEPSVWGSVVLVVVALCGTSAAYAIAVPLSLLGVPSPARNGSGFWSLAQVLSAVTAVAVIATAFGRLFTRHLFSGFDARPRRPAGGHGRVVLVLAALATAGTSVAVPGSASAYLCVFALPLLSGVLLTRPTESDTAVRPKALLDGERRLALVEAAVVAPAVAAASTAFLHWLGGSPLLVVSGLVVGCSSSAMVMVALSRWGRWTATRLVLAARGCLPRDVLGFLEDARRLGVLRRIGGVHQFRHAGLGARLAGEASADTDGRGTMPREVVLRSSVLSIGAVRSMAFDMLALVTVFLLVVSPMSAEGGFRADWHRTGAFLLGQWPAVLGVVGVLIADSFALRMVARRLRIDAEGVELNEGRRLRLRWEDVAEVRVRRIRPRKSRGDSPGLNVSYCLAMRLKPGRPTPPFLVDRHGWLRVWDMGPSEVVPRELEAALSCFAAGLWRPED